MAEYLFIVPLFVAIAIGWWLGKKQQGWSVKRRPAHTLSAEYFNGLDYLLNENVDQAIESFIRALEINSDTIPAHLALAKLFRRKGDVERAIQIHQNLLARPDLNRTDFMRVQMALSRDYYAVGLLDRAENLLQEIIKAQTTKSTRHNALSLLIRLYEKESEWQEALETAEKLSVDERRKLANELAHYCCELAEQALQRKQYQQATQYLKKADAFDGAKVRMGLMNARIAMSMGQWKQAIRHLKQIPQYDKLFVSEVIPLLRQCYTEQGQLAEYVNYLKVLLGQAPSTTVMVELAEMIHQEQGSYAAGAFITEELKRRPSIKGFNRLIDLHIEYGSESAQDSLQVLRSLTGQLEASKPVYRCNSCGFSGRTLLWHCPSCKQWGTTKPIQGLEGE
ncbi:lipopolysaccharide assembly protein LapB [Pontibacter sp. JAM-7]|uniref:lipopolysaccharide assembly protein LapB n=1 Tax=Pontibacter sp. JAM-7 TaxID=3366581 RepID=UPI003AF9C8EF